MSWSYLPVAAVEYGEVCCSDTLPSAPSKSSKQTAESSCSASSTACSLDSRYGTTCEPSTAESGEERSTSSAADFPARTSPVPEKAADSTASAPASGQKWRASLARYDPATHSLKTAKCSLLEDSTGCSVTLPRWGSMQSGELSERTMPAHLTSGIASGFLPTVQASEARQGLQIRREGKKGTQQSLTTVIKMWPTPRANDAEKRGNIDAQNPRNGLAGAVRMPSPSATDWKSSSKDGQRRRQLTDPAMGVIPPGGRLNPEFVEWLMGWPTGSTAFSPLAMDRFHEFMRSHGGF